MNNNTSNPKLTGDISDSPKDKKQLQPEEVTMDLPDVEDIPGQENVRPPKMKQFADTTISSADEEGEGVVGLFDNDEDDVDDDTDVTDEEKELLERSENSTASPDDQDVIDAGVDDRDEDGELLNEITDTSGSDLDVPGSEDDDDNEILGEEDEENNSYSLGGDEKD